MGIKSLPNSQIQHLSLLNHCQTLHMQSRVREGKSQGVYLQALQFVLPRCRCLRWEMESKWMSAAERGGNALGEVGKRKDSNVRGVPL